MIITAVFALLYLSLSVSAYPQPADTTCTILPENQYDVIVYGATPAGFAAALAAKETGAKRVLLLEPTAHVGGMATAGGIGLRDCNHDEIRKNVNSTQYTWAMRNAKYYNVTSPVWQPDNWVGERTFLEMLDESGVELRTKTMFVEGSSGIRTALDGFGLRRITAIQLETESGPGEWLGCKYIIDASYEGEVMISSGHVSYTYGRESQWQYNESFGGVSDNSIGQFKFTVVPFINGTQPWLKPGEPLPHILDWVQYKPNLFEMTGEADDNLMAYSFRACLTQNMSNAVPIQRPEGYQSVDFELARRYIEDAITTHNKVEFPWGYLGYKGYPTKVKLEKYDACCGAAPVGIDAVGLALGYANGTRADRKAIYDKHVYYVKGIMWFWSNDSAVPANVRNNTLSYGLCADEWPDNNHFPTQLYVREAARLVGDKVFTQNDRIPYNETGGCLNDSVAVGSWGLDIHEMQRVMITNPETNEVRVFNEGLTKPNNGGMYFFEIPYYILLPRRQELVNLAVPNCPSVSHVAFSAIREEPTLWQLGLVAGTAAGIGLRHGGHIPLHDVDMFELQEAVKKQHVYIHWPQNREDCSGHEDIESDTILEEIQNPEFQDLLDIAHNAENIVASHCPTGTNCKEKAPSDTTGRGPPKIKTGHHDTKRKL